MNTKKLLALFGLRDIETKIYEELFSGGALTASGLAKRVGISRTSIYDLLERLTETGLVTETLQGGVKKFVVQPPGKIQLLIGEKERELGEAKQITQELQQAYEHKHTSAKPRLQLFEGRAELQQMMKDLLLYRDITVQAFWPIKKITALLSPEFMTKFHEERAIRNITLRVIWPTAQLSTLKTYPHLKSSPELKRAARIAPNGIDFSLGYSIYQNTVRFISSSSENFGFLVESAELANVMKAQFELIWRQSKKL